MCEKFQNDTCSETDGVLRSRVPVQEKAVRDRQEKWSFGKDINGVEDPMEIPKQRQKQTYPKLNLATKYKIIPNFNFCEIYKCENETTFETIKEN